MWPKRTVSDAVDKLCKVSGNDVTAAPKPSPLSHRLFLRNVLKTMSEVRGSKMSVRRLLSGCECSNIIHVDTLRLQRFRNCLSGWQTGYVPWAVPSYEIMPAICRCDKRREQSVWEDSSARYMERIESCISSRKRCNFLCVLCLLAKVTPLPTTMARRLLHSHRSLYNAENVTESHDKRVTTSTDNRKSTAIKKKKHPRRESYTAALTHISMMIPRTPPNARERR